MKTGSTVFLRPAPFADVGTATEIFATEIYEFPERIKAENVNFIVDLGSNVGYSCVHWLTEFPSADIIAFEPHPDHIKQVKKHLEANSSTAKVVLIPKAAGIEKGRLYLTDDEMSSALTNTPAEGTIIVEVTDWIAELPNRTIDLLKMDIEGSEYVLLSDPRFNALDIK